MNPSPANGPILHDAPSGPSRSWHAWVSAAEEILELSSDEMSQSSSYSSSRRLCFDGTDSTSDDDDEFLKRFRNQRIAELQQQQQSKSLSTSKQLQTFGTLSLVTPQEYVQIVDEMDATTSTQYLIVHLYHSTIHTCQMLQSSLEKLSQIMIHTQFIQVNALEANANLDMIYQLLFWL